MDKILKNPQLVSAEIFTTGFCNLDCSYCYIEKTEYLKKIHQDILKKIQSGDYIKELYDIYGDQLEALTFWGTEPLLSLNLLVKEVPTIVHTFPKLNHFGLSTNLMVNPLSVVDFIKAIPKDREIKVRIQVSIDGPPEITDKNRQGSATITIKNNLLNVVSALQTLDLGKIKVEFCLKPTWSAENLKWFINEPSRLYYYFYFFDEWIDRAKSINKSKNINLNLQGVPTMAVPGTYTSAEGKLFGKICSDLTHLTQKNKKFHLFYHHGVLNPYSHRMIRLLNYSKELSLRPDTLTCSAGRSQNQLGEQRDFHLCHRSLFMNHPNYVKELRNEGNWDFHLQQKDRIKLLKDKHIVSIDDELEMNRVTYTWLASQAYTKHKIACGLVNIKELVYSKQIDEVYEDEDLAYLFSIFINFSLGCPAENILQTGTLFSSSLSLYRLFGAGDEKNKSAFQVILEEVRNELSARE